MQAFRHGSRRRKTKILLLECTMNTETKSPLDVKPRPVECQLQLI
uniref:BLTX838 n=1 Tax=Nephila pilipes TaxID=299642 RepID=A0A076L104_NEPPI|nr:BLTX838 [Nephila pilipes]